MSSQRTGKTENAGAPLLIGTSIVLFIAILGLILIIGSALFGKMEDKTSAMEERSLLPLEGVVTKAYTDVKTTMLPIVQSSESYLVDLDTDDDGLKDVTLITDRDTIQQVQVGDVFERDGKGRSEFLRDGATVVSLTD